MNKLEFIKAIAEKGNITIKDADKLYDVVIDVLHEKLNEEGKIQLVGFGVFELKHKDAHEGLNPATGEKVQIPASKTPVFKFGKTFKDSFN